MSSKTTFRNIYKGLVLLFGISFVVTNVLGCSSTGQIYTINEEPIPTIGYYLTDSAGITLYYTTMDSAGKSNISGSELDDWPVFYTSKIVIPPSLKRSDFSTIKRSDGTLQTTYKGWPLYYYEKDDEPSDTIGQGVEGVWFLVGPNIPKASPGS